MSEYCSIHRSVLVHLISFSNGMTTLAITYQILVDCLRSNDDTFFQHVFVDIPSPNIVANYRMENQKPNKLNIPKIWINQFF